MQEVELLTPRRKVTVPVSGAETKFRDSFESHIFAENMFDQ